MKNKHLWCYTPQSLLITSVYSLSRASLHALSASSSDTQKTILHHIRQFIMTPSTLKADVWFVFCLVACRYICISRPLRSHDEVRHSLNPPLIFSLIAFLDNGHRRYPVSYITDRSLLFWRQMASDADAGRLSDRRRFRSLQKFCLYLAFWLTAVRGKAIYEIVMKPADELGFLGQLTDTWHQK